MSLLIIVSLKFVELQEIFVYVEYFIFQPFFKFQKVFASKFKKFHEIGIFFTCVYSQCKSLSAKKLYCFNYFDEAFSVFLHVRFDFLAGYFLDIAELRHCYLES